MNNPLLKVENCGIQFGGLKALDGLDFSLNSGELLGVIGPNGAGKTTFFNLLTGVYLPTDGSLFFKSNLLNQLKPHQINQLGISRTFQNIRLFLNLSVLDNVCIAFHQHIQYSLWDVICHRKKYIEEEKQIKAKALELLERFHLHETKNELAKNLSYGDQRRLEMVRALATRPQLLLLDEPAAGMNPTEKKELIELIRHLHQELNLAIILIEHDMSVMMQLCPRIIVLDYGVVIAEGTPEYIRQHPAVIKAYLGEKKDAKSL
ncbi:MAG: ABC transporter ATP-binding protein [Deltaproteobacteria bacterium]|nr:ABC transporter ATP-binding protein [Deltaproteobacteria bacterium]